MFGTTIKINNKEYVLKYTINTLCRMSANGFNVMNLGEQTMDFVAIRELFFYGLQKYHSKEINDSEAAGDLMSDYLDCGGDFEGLAQLITEALTHSLGIKQTEGK